MAGESAKFTFQPLTGKSFNSIDRKETQEYFLKWSMKDRFRAQVFSFDQPFQAYQKQDFVLAFMQDQSVLQNLLVLSSSGKLVPIGVKADTVEVEQLPCSILSMDFFDRLHDNTIVRESGHIVKCLDEFYDEMTISDELRKMLLLEDSDNYDTYSDSERAEFLFHLFKHICLGGSVCQYEDTVTPYLDITKLIYKDLVSVQKASSSGALHISSVVFKISAATKGQSFYPADTEHEQNFAYLIVDPLKRHVTVLYHKFGSSAFG